ncbi:MAG: Sec-independent protein translocase protein TatB [Alphaproteobacteria bacterium]|jgi:sec-independent protein translocase protein TatB
MFDLGWPELMLIMVVALIVIGPKELPNAIRTVMGIVRKVRGMTREFQSGLDDIARETGLDEVKRDFQDIDYYDPGEALKSIAESDSNMIGLEDDPDAGNSILDPASKRAEPSQIATDATEPDAPASDTAAAEPNSSADAVEETSEKPPVSGGSTT